MGMRAAGADAGTRLRSAGDSRAGRVRLNNQDHCWVGPVGPYTLALVADGMGGHQTGEVASGRAVEVIRDTLRDARGHAPAALARALQAANLEVYHAAEADPRHEGMGTTLTGVLVDDQVGLLVHVGDSRAYLLRDGRLRQLTADHSWVADRVRQGLLTEGEARQHRWRNVLTNALGAAPQFQLELRHVRLRSLDRLLLVSDGVTSLVDEPQLVEALGEDDPDAAVAHLLDAADGRGSPDNVTAVAVYVDAVAERPKRYTLPDEAPYAVSMGETQSGIRAVEERYPGRGPFRWMRKQPWYPYRLWIVGSLYLLLLILVFGLWRPAAAATAAIVGP